MRDLKTFLFKTCPNNGRIIGLKRPSLRSEWLLPLAGLAALVWVVMRVVPKPSRAAYPCQKVAIPLAGAFLASLAGHLAWPALKNRLHLPARYSRYMKAGLVVFCLFTIFGMQTSGSLLTASAAYPAHTPNAPIGTARGLQPGRVVWAHDPDLTDWAGPNSGQRWYDRVNLQVAKDMLSWSLRGYTGETSDTTAWDAIIRHFNGGSPYQAGEKVLIKINLVTSVADSNYNQLSQGGVTLDSIANSPQMLLALLDQLINRVGIAQADITVSDPTGLLINYLYTPLHGAYPSVRYEDNRGGTGPEGESTRRARAEYTSPCVPYYWSTPDANGKTQDCVVQSYNAAKYLINFALLKSHDRSGITVTAKNHYGSMLRTPIGGGRTLGSNHYDIHARLPLQPTNTAWRNMGYYRPMVDLMGNRFIGGKTLLYLVDGTYGGKNWNAIPSKWSMAPFSNDWPSSLFLSMDPVAIDSVAFDFLSQQWPEHALAYEGVQDYLHEAAQAAAPPSGTCYDPEKDGTCMASLGVHEHWNNAVSKQYTRNLSSGNGIELLLLESDPGVVERTLSVTSWHGTVTKNPQKSTYQDGESVQVTATAASGWAFSRWSGTVTSTANPLTITIAGDMQVTANYSRTRGALFSDFDGDQKSDPVKFDATAHTVSWLKSTDSTWGNVDMGTDTFTYVPRSDFDGDGKTDPAKFVPSIGAVWYVKSSTAGWEGKYLGPGSYQYVEGSDFDGDGKTDPSIFISTNALWTLQSTTGTWQGLYMGPGSYSLVKGSDFDGDGKTDPALFVSSVNALWYYKSSTSAWQGVYMGPGTYNMVPASDFDGDGKTDPAQFVPSSQVLWYQSSSTGTWIGVYMGSGTYDYIAACDFDGDGKTDPAKFDPATKVLWYLKSTTGTWQGVWLEDGSYSVVN